MSVVVTEHFKDWDGFFIPAGTVADRLVQTGFNSKGTPFYNLIKGNRVVAVTLNKPPVEDAK